MSTSECITPLLETLECLRIDFDHCMYLSYNEINFKILLHILYWQRLSLKIQIKMCKIYTALSFFFANVQFYTVEKVNF